MSYRVDKGTSGNPSVELNEAVQAVEELAPGETVTIENTTVEHEYDVFYGGVPGKDHWRTSAPFTQHQTVKAPNHREAMIKALYCNHSSGTRYLVVGPEKRTWTTNGTEKTGRIFEINSVEKGDPRIVYTYTHRNKPGWDWWGNSYSRGSVLPTKYYRVDEVGR